MGLPVEAEIKKTLQEDDRLYQYGGLDVQELTVRKLIEFHEFRTREEQTALIAEYQRTRDLRVRDKAVSSVSRYVIKIAHSKARSYNLYYLLLDLIQEGFFGVFIAIEKFDTERGIAFSTYVTWWIKQKMDRFIMNTAAEIRIPVHRIALQRKLRKSMSLLRSKLGNEVDVDHDLVVSEGLMTPSEMKSISKRPIPNTVSMNTPVSDKEDGDAVIGDLIPDNRSLDFAQHLEDEEIREKILNFLRTKFNYRHAQAVILYLGLEDDEPMTLEEVGKVIPGKKVTRERIRQIVDRILKSPRLAWFLRSLRLPTKPTVFAIEPDKVVRPKSESIKAISEFFDRKQPTTEEHTVQDEKKLVDLDKMTPDELMELAKKRKKEESTKKRRKSKRDRSARRLYLSWLQQAEKVGMTPQEVLELCRKGVPKVEGYRNPDNPEEVWTGMGRSPRWYNEKIEEGVDPESMRDLV